ASTAATVRLSLPEQPAGAYCVDLFDRATHLPITADGSLEITVPPYEGRWFRLLNFSSTELV
ncbi:MAG: hypothetical protein ABJA16_09525, partial [Nakamurella sp.]